MSSSLPFESTTKMHRIRYYIPNQGIFSLRRILYLTLLIIFVIKTDLYSQNNEILVMFNEQNAEMPFSLYATTSPNLAQIKLNIAAPSKFASFNSGFAGINVLPLSDNTLLITCESSDGISCFSHTDLPLITFITDNSANEQEYVAEFLNANHQSISESNFRVTVPSGFPLPGPCSQSFININTGVGLNPMQIDANWHYLSNQVKSPTYVMNYNYPAQSPTANWINYNGDNQYGLEMTYFQYVRNICATVETNGFISLCVAADNRANVYFNNQLIAQTTGGRYGFMHFSCIQNVPVQILAGTNEVRVEVFNRYSQTGFIIANSLLTTANGVLGLSSDRCCGDNVGARIFGKKIWDLNCNGRIDPGEKSLAGWTIMLSDPVGGIQSTTTDINGNYSFPNLNPGAYTLMEQIQNGWSQSSSAGPFNVYVGPNDNVNRDFLNCKPPDCAELFTHYQTSEECCSSELTISNANGSALQSLSFTVTGGVINSINTNLCSPTSSPINLNGASSGTLTFNTNCTQQNPVVLYINASSNTADGFVCINWNGNFVQGGQSFSCRTETCIQCERMPQICNNKLSVTANVFGPVNTDYRNFKILNNKQPISNISSVDIEFINESIPPHIGGGLVVDGINRSWTYNNSGGPAAAYTQVRLGCSTQSAVHGPSASNTVEFNLGVDNTTVPLYSGIVKIKIGYCDGDTCQLEYNWQPPIKHEYSDLLRQVSIPNNLHVLSLEIAMPEQANQFSIELFDENAQIHAVSVPSMKENEGTASFTGYKVYAEKNTAYYINEQELSIAEQSLIPISIIYEKSGQSSANKIPVYIRFYNFEGREIGFSTEEMEEIVISNIDESGLNINSRFEILPTPAKNNAVILLELKNADNISLALYDISSREVLNIVNNKYFSAGKHNFEISTNDLPIGTYFVKLKSSDSSQIMKMIIVK